MRYKVLIVDDAVMNRELLKEMLQDEYDVLEAEDGKAALQTIEREKGIHAILLDLVMPVMDGYEVLEHLHRQKQVEQIPVIVISGENSAENINRCFAYGVVDFISRPFMMAIIKNRIQNVIKIYDYKNSLEDKVEEQTRVLRKAYDTVKKQAAELAKRNQEIIDMLGTVVEYRNVESGEHVKRVKGYTEILAYQFSRNYPEYGLTKEKIDNIAALSALHDIGKITIPDSILLKPGRLTNEEFEYMKSHTISGCEILDAVEIKWEPEMKKIAYEIVRHHHERYDGKGYPDKLKGEEIPISAQLVSLADVYDALVNERCYKDAFSNEEAYHMIVSGECGVFSPKLMEVFRIVRKEFEQASMK